MRNTNKGGYTVILSILMVGFILLLSFGVFGLVLKEAKDTKNMEYYLKSYNAAEGGIELALYELKINDYYIDKTVTNSQNMSKIYGDLGNFDIHNSPELNYSINTTTNVIDNSTIESGKFNIISLKGVNKIDFNILTGNSDKVVWNILSKDSGISGIGDIDTDTTGYYKYISDYGDITYNEKDVFDFLDENDDNYLYINNQNDSTITYRLESLTPSEKFITDTSVIESSAEIFGLKQNLRVNIDNNEHLSLLKYSIYSPY